VLALLRKLVEKLSANRNAESVRICYNRRKPVAQEMFGSRSSLIVFESSTHWMQYTLDEEGKS